jgi:hypothetical protein
VSAALTNTEAGNCIGIVSRVSLSGCSGQTGTLKKKSRQEGRNQVSTFGNERVVSKLKKTPLAAQPVGQDGVQTDTF